MMIRTDSLIFINVSSKIALHLKEKYGAYSFTESVEGCLNVITDPKQFPIRVWDWIDNSEIQGY